MGGNRTIASGTAGALFLPRVRNQVASYPEIVESADMQVSLCRPPSLQKREGETEEKKKEKKQQGGKRGMALTCLVKAVAIIPGPFRASKSGTTNQAGC